MQIGEQLKEARELKNLTLDDIQATTKIQKRYLVAIEQDDFHALPGRFYARAFIKEYANAVELDPNLLLASFDEDNIEENNDDETKQYSRLKRTRRSGREKGTSILSYLPSIIVVLLIASILIVAWTLYQKSLSKPAGDSLEEQETDEYVKRDPDENQSATNGEDQGDENEDAHSNEEVEDDQNEEQTGEFRVIKEGTGNPPESIIGYATNSDMLTIKLQATDDSYVQVQEEDGTTHLDLLFTPDMTEELELSAEGKIYFNIGHTPSMSIYINDDLLEYPTGLTGSVHQKIWLEIN